MVKRTDGLLLGRIGMESFYIYLTHTTVVWFITRSMKKVLHVIGIVGDMKEFFALMIPSAIIIWGFVFLLRRTVDVEKKKLGNWINQG